MTRGVAETRASRIVSSVVGALIGAFHMFGIASAIPCNATHVQFVVAMYMYTHSLVSDRRDRNANVA